MKKTSFFGSTVENRRMSSLRKITAYLDDIFCVKNFNDYPGAYNGLQVENTGEVKKIAAAVDACESVIHRAIQEKVSLLIVHHGLLWRGVTRWTGSTYRKMNAVISGDLALYSIHLPLDAHPEYGNNVLLARECGLTEYKPFLEEFGTPIGVRVQTAINREELLKQVERAVGGRVQLAPGGPEICRSVGVVTGGAGTQVAQAAAEGVDTLITGEGPHWTYSAAEEAGINLIYAGHYATETFGVKAIAQHLSKCFEVPWIFIDHPSGR